MPLRQIRKHKNSKSKSRSRSSNSRNRKSRKQRGGDPGRIALPMSYFSANNTSGYYADKKGCPNQHAVSRGVISRDGNWAGPNLYPQLGGRNSQRKRSRHNKNKK